MKLLCYLSAPMISYDYLTELLEIVKQESMQFFMFKIWIMYGLHC